ncbi:tetratricopeptide repeat protein [Cerasicoccus maritimus]|uniref:tetratricopeptide repeat protein n=1 Tax=Cerasicoccus maritimus TaxID=490089 RepID=UPI0028528F81|nr:tetratricopeptide repeat protein [Cerasicoccus maritimus]
MTETLNRAWELLNIRRFKDARAAAQEALSTDPHSVGAHIIIAQAAIQQDQPMEALESINRAIGMAPDEPECFITRARIYIDLKRIKQARSDGELALRMSPDNAAVYGVLAWTYGADGDWLKALQFANDGLKVDPEDSNCINARARALLFLNKNSEAFETIEHALANDPEDVYTHTNAGWAKLQAGDRESALNHFTEALRREPNYSYARDGLIAAMKAKSSIYGALLAYSFFMTGLRPISRVGVLIGAYLVYQVSWRTLVARGHLMEAGIIISLWMCLVLLTWAGDAIFNLLLMLSRRGRRILTTSQKWISAAVAFTCYLGFSITLLYFALYEPNPLFLTGIGFLLTSLPLAYAGRFKGKKLGICLTISFVCMALLLISAYMHFAGYEIPQIHLVRDTAIFILVAFSWIGPSILARDF